MRWVLWPTGAFDGTANDCEPEVGVVTSLGVSSSNGAAAIAHPDVKRFRVFLMRKE